MHKLLCIVAIVETVCNGSGLRDGDVIIDPHIGHAAIVDDSNTPEAMLGVMPFSEDDFAIKSYFANGRVEQYFATGVTENCNQ
jgi:hypothetical protein